MELLIRVTAFAPSPTLAESPPDEQYIGNMSRGTMSVIPIPSADALARHTAQVVQNNDFDETRQALTRTLEKTQARAVPRRAGDPTPIKHVIYVIEENRTYDQVSGDLPQGDGDPSLMLFGRDSAPNHHALAEQLFCLITALSAPRSHRTDTTGRLARWQRTTCRRSSRPATLGATGLTTGRAARRPLLTADVLNSHLSYTSVPARAEVIWIV